MMSLDPIADLRLEVVDRVSEAGHGSNEDALGATGWAAWVIDASAELREQETADRACRHHPRLKPMDDASAILVRITRYGVRAEEPQGVRL